MGTMLDVQLMLIILSKSGTTIIIASHRETTETSRGVRHYSKITHLILTGNEFMPRPI